MIVGYVKMRFVISSFDMIDGDNNFSYQEDQGGIALNLFDGSVFKRYYHVIGRSLIRKGKFE